MRKKYISLCCLLALALGPTALTALKVHAEDSQTEAEKKAAEQTKEDAKKAAEQTKESAKKAAEQTKESAKKAAEQTKEDAKQAAEQTREDAKQAAEQTRESAKKAFEQTRESAKQQAELVKKDRDNRRGAAIQRLETQHEKTKTLLQLYAKFSGLTGAEREKIKTQLEAQVEQLKQEQEQLHEDYKDQLELLRERRSDELEAIREQRKAELETLRVRRQELETEDVTKLTDDAKTEHLKKAEQHAAKVSQRLDSASARLVNLTAKIQTRIDGLTDANLAVDLKTQLASLVDDQQNVQSLVGIAKASLANISNVAGDNTVVATAQADVKDALAALTDLRDALQKIASKL